MHFVGETFVLIILFRSIFSSALYINVWRIAVFGSTQIFNQ